MNDQRNTKQLAGAVLLAAAYYFAACFGLRLVVGEEPAPMVWLPSGLLLGALLRAHQRDWWRVLSLVFAADVLAEFSVAGPVWADLAYALTHVLEGTLGALLLRRVTGERMVLERVAGVMALAWVPGFTSTLLAATLNATIALASGAKAGFWTIWLVWWGATTVGIMIATPLLLTWASLIAWLRQSSPRQLFEGGWLLFVSLAASLVIFQVRSPGDVVVVPLLMAPFLLFIWAALRFGAPWVALVSLAIGPVAAWYTAHGIGAMSVVGNSVRENALLLQLYLTIASLPAFLFSAALSERKELLLALQASEERFRQLAENIREVFWLIDWSCQRVIYASPAFEPLWGLPVQELYRDPRAWSRLIHPEDRPRVEQSFFTTVGTSNWEEEYRIVRPDGSLRWIRDQGYPIRNESGAVYRVAGIAEDITDRKRAEESHAALEVRLRQAQKMEAIGQLAGGVAHDFNNLLTIIQGHASILQSPDRSEADLAPSIEEISRAADRAANLTRQLLTLSRRQVLQPRPLDLNEVVANMTRMLQRVIGEHIVLEARYAPGGAPVRADPGMLEQVIMNLAVNARDAMPRGGQLVIQTAAVDLDEDFARAHPNARPGPFVRLCVGDTGCGIAPEDLPRIFEPFFTTKAVGKGTGLGLAMVFGIVGQHHGWIEVESGAEAGTVFCLFFPRLSASATSPAAPSQAPSTRRGTETILLVEDDGPVRALARDVLRDSGYLVHEAADGRQALEVWSEHHDEIDLLFTDLVMPGGLSGHDLAEQLRADRPTLKVLGASGYSQDVLGRDSPFGTAFPFLQKPYDQAKLTRAVRDCLDAELT